MNRLFDHLEYVIYIMNRVLEGWDSKRIKDDLIQKDPFSFDSSEYRRIISNWLIRDYVESFSKAELTVFSKLMTSNDLNEQTKREILFWKNCQRDDLVREITLNQIYIAYHKNESFIFRKDLMNYIIETTGYTKTTAKECVTRYITVVSKLGIVERNNEMINLKYFRPKKESVATILFFLFNRDVPPSKILQAEGFKYLLLDNQDIIDFLSEFNTEGLIEFAMAGDVVRLEPKIDFEVFPDVITQ